MLRIVLMQPGSTDFDEQRRIKGSLDIPLNSNGTSQVQQTVEELSALPITHIYASTSQSALQTAEALGKNLNAKIKQVDKLRNVDHGLWHGKLIEDVKLHQPKVYRQGQESPEQLCPPGGESVGDAQERLRNYLAKLIRKHKQGMIALIVPDPLRSMIRSLLANRDLDDLWQSECDQCSWEVMDVEAANMALTN